jgi:beta-N-acetylhexosaminidase
MEQWSHSVIIVATGTPYEIAALPEATAFLTAYSFQGVAIESAAQIITGTINPRGKLAISIPSLTHPV